MADPDDPAPPAPPAADGEAAAHGTNEKPEPAASPGAAAPKRPEPRARDVARSKSTRDLEQHQLDPKTIAQLAAWFDLPSFADLEEQEKARAEEAEQARGMTPEARERQARIAEVADQTIIARMEARTTAGDPLVAHLPPPLELRVGSDIRRVLDTFEDRVGTVAEPRELDRPSMISEMMRERTPQAILRDLHRPEGNFDFGYPLPAPEPGIAQLTATVRKVVTADYKVRPNLVPASVVLMKTFVDRRRQQREGWETILARKREAESTPKPEPATDA